MFKRFALLATFTVATVCGWAPQAKAYFFVALAITRWHHHYAVQAHPGWDYASSMHKHGSWGSHAWHWGAAMAWSARPWPAHADHLLFHKHDGYVYPAGWHDGHGGFGHGGFGHGGFGYAGYHHAGFASHGGWGS